MEYKNNQLCRLCLKIISDKNFQLLDKTAREMLDVLVLKLALDLTENPLMCTSCAKQLVNCFNFKSTCLYTEDAIVPYIDTNSKLNLKEVYMKEEGGIKIEDGDICRLCFTVIASHSFRCYNEVDEEIYFVKDVFPKYFPELNIRCTEDPKICKACVVCLQNFLNFSTMCLEVDNRIAHFIKDNELDDKKPVALASVMQVTEDVEPFIKNEEVEIKSEATDNESPTLTYRNIDNVEQEVESVERRPPNCSKDQGHSESPSFKCKICPYKTQKRRNLTQHLRIHKDPMFKCAQCSFKTKHRNSIRRHRSTHSRLSSMFTCEICSYETKLESDLKMHELSHKKNPRTIKFKCTFCAFQTRNKINLKNHMYVHKDPNRMFKCEICAFKTKYKGSLKTHMLSHKSLCEIKTFHCDLCDFVTKYKQSHQLHMLKH